MPSMSIKGEQSRNVERRVHHILCTIYYQWLQYQNKRQRSVSTQLKMERKMPFVIFQATVVVCTYVCLQQCGQAQFFYESGWHEFVNVFSQTMSMKVICKSFLPRMILNIRY